MYLTDDVSTAASSEATCVVTSADSSHVVPEHSLVKPGASPAAPLSQFEAVHVIILPRYVTPPRVSKLPT